VETADAKSTENQPEVAIGIERSGVPRKDLFLVGKLWNTHHRPHLVQEDLEMSLDELKTDYLDVYLMHFPVAFKPGKEMQPLSSDGESITILSYSVTPCPLTILLLDSSTCTETTR
jgi:L-glyceraldehyde reductase